MIDDGPVRAAIRAAIDAGHEEAVHVAAYHNGKLCIDIWDGLADPEKGIPAAADTLYNVYYLSDANTGYPASGKPVADDTWVGNSPAFGCRGYGLVVFAFVGKYQWA